MSLKEIPNRIYSRFYKVIPGFLRGETLNKFQEESLEVFFLETKEDFYGRFKKNA